jgi:hypothetical protein
MLTPQAVSMQQRADVIDAIEALREVGSHGTACLLSLDHLATDSVLCFVCPAVAPYFALQQTVKHTARAQPVTATRSAQSEPQQERRQHAAR